MPEGVRENGERGGIGVTAKSLRSAITFIECCHCQSPRLRWGMREQAAICFYEVYYELQFERLTKAAVASSIYMSSGAKVIQFFETSKFWSSEYKELLAFPLLSRDIIQLKLNLSSIISRSHSLFSLLVHFVFTSLYI